MSLPNQITITCPACQHQQAFTIWRSINVTLDPELKKRLLDRSLFSFHCETCGHNAIVDQELLYHDMDCHVMIMLGRQKPEEPAFPGPLGEKIQAEYSYRFVGSVNELIEKVLILDADLDDRAVEMFKVPLMSNIDEIQRDSNPELYFSEIYADEESQEMIRFVLVNEAGTSSISVLLEDVYREFVDKFCGGLPTVVSECGQWLRVDREYALKHFGTQE